MKYPQLHESSSVFGLLTKADVLEKGRPSGATNAHPALTHHAVQERNMSLIPPTPGIYPAQDTPRATYDGISVRDDLLRRQAERGSEMLLRAMIRELESMGALA